MAGGKGGQSPGAGGGSGGGAGGGSGGAGSSQNGSGAGGLGGTNGARDGGAGDPSTLGGGGGGGGGFNGYEDDGADIAQSGAIVAAGNGGAGGNGVAGGGGGAGGFGAIASGANIANDGSIIGGDGGNGGDGSGTAGLFTVYGGSGGDGGSGLTVTAADNAFVANGNTGSIAGGDAGDGGLGGSFGGVGGAGVDFIGTGSGARLSNAGTVTGGDAGSSNGSFARFPVFGGAGVAFAGSNATLNNQATGTISGGRNGSVSAAPPDIRGAGAGVAFAGSGGTVSNAGTIQGSSGGAFGGAGVFFGGANSKLTNLSLGTIKGGQTGSSGFFNLSSAGVVFDASGGSLTNRGTIEGGAAVSQGSSGDGVVFNVSGGTLTNTGTILGGANSNFASGVSGTGMTIVNDGDIEGGTFFRAQGAAINFTGGDNFLALGTFAQFKGALLVQGGTLTFDQAKGTGLPSDVTLSTQISGAGAVVKAGTGALTFSSASQDFSGGTTIRAGSLVLGAAGSAGSGAISFQASAGNTATLSLQSSAQPSGAPFANTLDSFGTGDFLNLRGFDSMSATVTYNPDGQVLTVSNTTTSQSFTLSNPGATAFQTQSDGQGGTTVSVVCFATSTMIRTVRGDVAVETLKVGDVAVTASGAARPIKWIGKRSFDFAAHPAPAMVRPVRVAAGAFGAGRPYRDLMLSPHHAVAVTCLDEVLIPIRLLMNGSSIAQIEDAGAVTYWHVELDSHDILVANGLPAESYIDVGNRCDFEGQETLVLHPLFEARAHDLARAAYCRPLVTGGAVLAAVRAQIAALAGEAAIEASASDFRLLADGTLLVPVVKGHTAAFVVPAGAKDVRLVSPAWSPHDADRMSPDDRRLGVMLETLSIDGLLGTVTDIPLDHPGLVAGFHPVERNATGCWRWTDGEALLAPTLWRACPGSFVLRMTGQFAPASTRPSETVPRAA